MRFYEHLRGQRYSALSHGCSRESENARLETMTHAPYVHSSFWPAGVFLKKVSAGNLALFSTSRTKTAFGGKGFHGLKRYVEEGEVLLVLGCMREKQDDNRFLVLANDGWYIVWLHELSRCFSHGIIAKACP